MGEYKNKAYPLRIDGILMQKMKVIAERNDRTTNKQIENIIKTFVYNYEKENGTILIEE